MSSISKGLSFTVHRRSGPSYYSGGALNPVSVFEQTYEFSPEILSSDKVSDDVYPNSSGKRYREVSPGALARMQAKIDRRIKEPIRPHRMRIPDPPVRREGQSLASWKRASIKHAIARQKTIRFNLRKEVSYYERLKVYKRKQQEVALLKQRVSLLSVRQCKIRPHLSVEKPFYQRLAYHPFIVGSTVLDVILTNAGYTEGPRPFYERWSGAFPFSSQGTFYVPGHEPLADVDPASLLLLPEVLEAKELATVRARENLLEQHGQEKVHLANMLVEVDKTLLMISEITQQIKQLLSTLRGKATLSRSASAKKNAKAIADGYLRAHFGLEPLIKDLQTALTQLTASSTLEARYLQVKGRAVSRCTVKVGERTLGVRVSVREQVKYSIDDAALNSLATSGLLNPWESLWEVTPFSYIVDWFIQVGKWLQSWEATRGLDFKSGTRTVVIDVALYQDISTTQVVNNYWMVGNRTVNALATSRCFEKTRTVLTEAPTPYLPRWKSPVSVSHLITSAALAVQRLVK